MSKKMIVSGITGEVLNDEKPMSIGFFFDEADAIRYARRKKDWHTNKGKRRIKGGYKGDRYV